MYNESLRLQKEIILCEDGTNTLYSREFNEPYHSTRDGALQESLQKHVKPSFKLKSDKEKLTILDICFGLGYNTFATLYHIKKNKLKTKVHILSPEFDEGLVRSLDTFEYPSEFENLKPVIEAIAQNLHYEDDQFKIDVLIGDARQSIPKLLAPRSSLLPDKIDVVYQDAFSPKVNPLLWTKEWFADIRALCRDDAILTTYSTAAATRMGLYENGFELHSYDAPNTRRSLIASPQKIETLAWIDMVLKKQRNPDAKSLKDMDFQ